MRVDARAAIAALLLLVIVGAAVAVQAKHHHHKSARNADWGNFTNPVLWEDHADVEIFRVNETYYYSASTMHYSPGAPVMRSYDLVNWEHIGHSVPVLDYSPAFDLNGTSRAYVAGIWASYMGYRKSNGLFYWGGCINSGGGSYIYTASNPAGPWTKHGPLNTCFYDAGLLIDDDDTMYVAYGTTNINVAQLSADGYSNVVKSQQVLQSTGGIYIEGSRFYKRNGYYYLWNTQPANAQWVSRASSVWGPYTMKNVLNNMKTPVPGAGIPHQGGLVTTPAGDWYYMAFIDNYPGGRTPVLAPIDWVDDWPVIRTVAGGWGASYPYPVAPHPMPPHTGTDSFTTSALRPEWEWNHNPDNTKWSAGKEVGGLVLQTATVTKDLYQARNTLTRRILGPVSNGTIALDFSEMLDGDRAGLALFRDQSAWIGIMKDDGVNRLVFMNNLTMNSKWQTTNTGEEADSVELDESVTTIWLCVSADIHPGVGRQATFFYSMDGKKFTQMGAYTMTNAWEYFMGYRWGIFNYATKKLGGEVLVPSFTIQAPTTA